MEPSARGAPVLGDPHCMYSRPLCTSIWALSLLMASSSTTAPTGTSNAEPRNDHGPRLGRGTPCTHAVPRPTPKTAADAPKPVALKRLALISFDGSCCCDVVRAFVSATRDKCIMRFGVLQLKLSLSTRSPAVARLPRVTTKHPREHKALLPDCRMMLPLASKAPERVGRPPAKAPCSDRVTTGPAGMLCGRTLLLHLFQESRKEGFYTILPANTADHIQPVQVA